jgi:hypothetical protein
MRYLAVLMMVLLAVPVASATDAEIEANMTLGDDFSPIRTSATAIGIVNVTLVEPEEPPITGLFLTPFDYEGLSAGFSSFLSSLFSFFS